MSHSHEHKSKSHHCGEKCCGGRGQNKLEGLYLSRERYWNIVHLLCKMALEGLISEEIAEKYIQKINNKFKVIVKVSKDAHETVKKAKADSRKKTCTLLFDLEMDNKKTRKVNLKQVLYDLACACEAEETGTTQCRKCEKVIVIESDQGVNASILKHMKEECPGKTCNVCEKSIGPFTLFEDHRKVCGYVRCSICGVKVRVKGNETRQNAISLHKRNKHQKEYRMEKKQKEEQKQMWKPRKNKRRVSKKKTKKGVKND